MRVLLAVALTLAVSAFVSLASSPRQSQAATSTLFISQTCSDSGANVTFTWQGNDPTAVQQWLDLSLFDNGWQDGTFVSAGPFSGGTTSFTWNGLLPGTLHLVRVNQMFADGSWDPSPTFQVMTGCAAGSGSAPATSSGGSAPPAQPTPTPAPAPAPPPMQVPPPMGGGYGGY